jgi:hypothetical protein
MYEARTDRLASLDKARESRVYGIKDILTTLLFFCAPYTYLARLENAWSDRVVSLEEWQQFWTTVSLDWSDTNLLVS